MAADWRFTALRGASAQDLVASAAARLREAGSPTARLDADVLVAHAFGRDRAWLLAHAREALEPEAAAALAGWVERRAAGEPIAYIRGFKEWLSIRVLTDRRALIPRPETELLAEAAIEEIAARLVRDTEPISAWEVATGSGAVALALALRFRTALALGRVRLAASDISAEAVELASENLAANGVAGLVALGCGDLLDPPVLPPPLQPDVVVANLPYLTTEEALAGSGSLRHEPRAALDGGPDGLHLIRRLLARLPDRLAPGGVALLEVGAGQARAVRELVGTLPMACAVTTLPDLAGVERVVRIERS
ncbi:MAG TPA: peptide chain release factor N(5)-glutamine methyltransferase [Candidatus Limnocylindria bacterium]|nr:peptide chain release factor N(5)-glutamine methyltransferase [Candidatus Limnocylindria bacterium]